MASKQNTNNQKHAALIIQQGTRLEARESKRSVKRWRRTQLWLCSTSAVITNHEWRNSGRTISIYIDIMKRQQSWELRCTIIKRDVENKHNSFRTCFGLWVSRLSWCLNAVYVQIIFESIHCHQAISLETQGQRHLVKAWRQTVDWLNSIWLVITDGIQTKHKQPKTCCFHYSSTGNKIGNTGVKALCEALRTNTTLTVFNISSDYKQRMKRRRENNQRSHRHIEKATKLGAQTRKH